jgi:hypothetical protein
VDLEESEFLLFMSLFFFSFSTWSDIFMHFFYSFLCF